MPRNYLTTIYLFVKIYLNQRQGESGRERVKEIQRKPSLLLLFSSNGRNSQGGNRPKLEPKTPS